MASIGEETYEKEGTCTLTEEYTWIVDPIDVRALSSSDVIRQADR